MEQAINALDACGVLAINSEVQIKVTGFVYLLTTTKYLRQLII